MISQDRLLPYINVKLELLGHQPVSTNPEMHDFVTMVVAQYREKERLLASHLCPADQRIQTFLYDYLQERPDIAIREAEAAIAMQPDYAAAQNVLGAALAGVGQRDRARAAFEASLKAAPRDPATHSNLAMLELEAGNIDAARRHFAEALMIDPANPVARDGLARLPAR